MTKKLKNIIKNAVVAKNLSIKEQNEIEVSYLLLIDTGKRHDDTIDKTKSEYNNFIIIAYSDKNSLYYLISEDKTDAMLFWNINRSFISFDFPYDLGCVRIHGFRKPISISMISDTTILTSRGE